MKEYEIVFTFLNGCAGAAHPQTRFEEAELSDPADYDYFSILFFLIK